MIFGGQPVPLPLEFEELGLQKERDRDVERAHVALELAALAGVRGSGTSRIQRLKRILRTRHDHI